MKALDIYLQSVRIRKARKFIRKNDTVLDIGSADGTMFKKWKNIIKFGYGIDPILKKEVNAEFYKLIPGSFPNDIPKGMTFDAITLLAVLEHIPTDLHAEIASKSYDLLNPKGRIIITVPSPQVDQILDVLLKLRLIEGMSLEEHYGFKPNDTHSIFSKGFKLLKRKRFQLGLNNLFVFEKID